jgi:lantibiotic modifying enzyme
MTTRRTFLEHAAAVAAGLSLPWAPNGLSALRGPRGHLARALDAARWIERSQQKTAAGTAYPADPLKPDSVNPDLYNGMPGVVLFFTELWHSTGDMHWLAAAEAAGDHLAAEVEHNGATLEPGLYTGLAGLAFTFHELHRAGSSARFEAATKRCLDLLQSRAKTVGTGVEWNDVNDIIGGTAGIGLTLLALGGTDLVPLAARAGHRLLALGQSAEGGTTWLMSPTFARNMPNFSHGTAGVAYFLATLHQATGEQAFLDGALKGAAYLDAIATRKGNGTVIRHHDGDGQNLFYLSWCHGPAGTARLFYRLHGITKDSRWLEWVDSLSQGILETGAPEQRSPGYWNNISQCCGNTGVGQFFLDLDLTLKKRGARSVANRALEDTMRRATSDDGGLRWVQAENRVQPDNLVAQTGFMQGAAGVGTFLLRLDAVERGKRWKINFPDTPFVV